MNDISNSSGKTGDLFSMGVAVMSITIWTHHTMLFLGTRNYTYVTFFWYIFSFLMFSPLCLYLNEKNPNANTYKITWTDLWGGQPLYWLSVLFAVGVCTMMLYLARSYEMLVRAPELYKR
jgi:hypothetical protein